MTAWWAGLETKTPWTTSMLAPRPTVSPSLLQPVTLEVKDPLWESAPADAIDDAQPDATEASEASATTGARPDSVRTEFTSARSFASSAAVAPAAGGAEPLERREGENQDGEPTSHAVASSRHIGLSAAAAHSLSLF